MRPLVGLVKTEDEWVDFIEHGALAKLEMGFWTRLSRQNWKLKNRARTTQKAKSNI
jgi:hypothetical protein